jgi:hypothetical protein
MATYLKTDDGRKFDFLTLRTLDGGFLLDEPAAVEQALTTPGVDGMRWRIESYQHRTVVVETVAALVDFYSAVQQARQYHKAVGRLAKVNVTVGTTDHTFENVHVVDVRPIPRIGKPVGASASASSEAHLLAAWTLQLTSFPFADDE